MTFSPYFLLSVGHWALEGPQVGIGPLGGSVSLQCHYTKGKEELVKYWCKEASFRFCSPEHIITTSGSEAEVHQNRTSIKDNHSLRVFRVIMRNLTNGDAGTYLCGVREPRKYDIWHPVDLLVTSGTLCLCCMSG